MKKFTNALMLGAISIATIVAMSSCGGDKEPEMTICPIEKELHFTDTTILKVAGAPEGVEVTYETSNEWVTLLSGDTLTAWHIGEAVITATAGDKKATYIVKVTANPKYNVATEPKLDCWGISSAELKTKMGTDPFQDQVKNGTGSIFYLQNAGTATYEAYAFEGDKLTSCALQVQKVSNEVVAAYNYFLRERYVRVTVQGDEQGTYFANALDVNATTILLQLVERQSTLTVIYVPYSHQSNAPALMPAKKGSHLFF